MTTYRVKFVSLKNSVILILSLLFIFAIILFGFFPRGIHPKFVSILCTVFIMTISWLLWQRFVTGRTTWEIDKNKIEINWVKKFAWTNNANVNLKWEEIKSITRGLDPNYYILKIKLVSGKTIRFIHDPLVTKDDFGEMLKVLYQVLNERTKIAN